MSLSCIPTLQSSVNLCLSSGGLPLLPGYSKSKSNPSKFLSLRKSMEVVINSFLLLSVLNMADILATPKFHPPTASSVFSSGFCCFRLVNLSYLISEMDTIVSMSHDNENIQLSQMLHLFKWATNLVSEVLTFPGSMLLIHHSIQRV